LSQTLTAPPTEQTPPPLRPISVAAAFTVAGVAVVVLAAVHLTQGTSGVGALDLLKLLVGQSDEHVLNVLSGSRLPRMLAGLLVGVALGCAGAALQSVARNALASPDTLAVNAGAHLAVVLSAALGFSLTSGSSLLSGLAALGSAFVGGLLAAGLVLLLSSGGTSPTRIILAGSAITMALQSLTYLFLLLYEEETHGLFAWGMGSLVQADVTPVAQLTPVVLLCIGGCMLLGHRMDILALGDDTAAVLGVRVRQTRLIAAMLAVMLAAAAVSLAGPIAFIGLVAPAVVRLAGARIPGLMRHRVMFPLSAMTGVIIMLLSDIAVRAVLGGQAGVEVPAGVVTTILGAGVLIALARRYRDAGPTRRPPTPHSAAVRSRRFVLAVVAVLAALLIGALLAGMLFGDRWVLTGDIVNWITGDSSTGMAAMLEGRWPRVGAALLAGLALAIAGSAVQAVCRNPLAEPGILGVTAGAGVGAVTLITVLPTAGTLTMTVIASGSALLAFGTVYLLAYRGGLNSDRLVLIGVGMWMGCNAISTFIIVAFDPWNTVKALTWLSGSTYGRTPEQLLPVGIALVVLTPLIVIARRELDLLALDDDTPRVLGMRLERARLLALLAAALLTATAVAAVGVVGFVGLVAPHIARALVGSKHIRVIPVAALIGALIISLADTVGRTVIAPAQIPAGLLAALIGTPYFVYLLWRTRSR
jgi:iron complex transport system permease protein